MSDRKKKARYNYEFLKKRIDEVYGTRKEFAEALGIGENTLSLKMNQAFGFTQEEIRKMRKLLRLTPWELANTFLIPSNESDSYFRRRKESDDKRVRAKGDGDGRKDS